MNILLIRSRLFDIFLMILGVSLMAIGIRVVYEPLGLVTGGLSGFAIVVEKIYPIPIWLTVTAINIPLFIIGLLVKGKGYIARTFVATVVFTVELGVIPEMNVASEDYLMAAICGGVLNGLGLGMVSITTSSTGGTDLLGAVIKKKCPQYSVATIIMCIDAIIVIMGAVTFGLRSALYALIAVYITSKIMDSVVEGIKYSKLMIIITEHGNVIADEIMKSVSRGVTGMKVVGMYSGEAKQMLMCAMSKKQSIKTIRIIGETDINAFVMISDIKEVLGEGFINMQKYSD